MVQAFFFFSSFFCDGVCQQLNDLSGGGGGAYQRGNVDAILLVATAHGEVLVNGLELGLGITGRDGLIVS